MPKRKAWYLGNTTVRNPKRLKAGLIALVNSPLHGNLEGRENEKEFVRRLDTAGVLYSKRLHESPEQDFSDQGRKWRAALMQLGFITPGSDELKQIDPTERPFSLTQNGQRLIQAQTLPGEQECFLRALLAHQIPSLIEKDFPLPVFSPLRIVLEVLAGLEQAGLDAALDQNEMAAIVQLTSNLEEVGEAIRKIAAYREEESQAGNTKRFAREYREQVAISLDTQNAATLLDYADSNFRYLKLTGLFVEDGHRLRFTEYKRTLIEQILAEPYSPLPSQDYPPRLWKGAILPTDSAPKAILAIEATADLLKRNGEAVDLPDLTRLDTPALSQLRLNLEDSWLKLLESRYAARQPQQWEEITQYLEAITQSRKSNSLIPQGEAPAYFEWATWRAFLAISGLANRPWEARRFRIDQEFLPVSPAPSNGPDMLFEFEDFALVVEVTLTVSSRQEAVEGEPVRRHVANLVDYYSQQGKRVYGLFIANRVDTNTAETFRIGVWYRPDDSRMALRIVPLTLEQFVKLFRAGFQGCKRLDQAVLEDLILRCLADSNADAPEWKRRIDEEVSRVVQKLQS
jgi:hypothetical protein